MECNIFHNEEIVKECEGCIFSGPRIVGGDDTIICRRCPYPKIRWWFGQPCENYIKQED